MCYKNTGGRIIVLVKSNLVMLPDEGDSTDVTDTDTDIVSG